MLYQEAYSFLRQMCQDNDEIKRKLASYMSTYFVRIPQATYVHSQF